MTSRPINTFNVDTVSFRNGGMIADFPSEPVESAAFWKSVAESQRKRLERAVEANKVNREGRIKAEGRVEQLRAQLSERKKA